MKILYIAGPMTPRGTRADTDNLAIEYILNVSDMIAAAKVAIAKGWAPYCPGLDMQYFLTQNGGTPISEAEIKAVSLAFLEVSDAILMLPRWETSPGSQAEYSRAVELGMPVYMSLEVSDETSNPR